MIEAVGVKGIIAFVKGLGDTIAAELAVRGTSGGQSSLGFGKGVLVLAINIAFQFTGTRVDADQIAQRAIQLAERNGGLAAAQNSILQRLAAKGKFFDPFDDLVAALPRDGVKFLNGLVLRRLRDTIGFQFAEAYATIATSDVVQGGISVIFNALAGLDYGNPSNNY